MSEKTPDATGTHAHYYLTTGVEPRGCLELRDDYQGAVVQYLFRDGSVLEVDGDTRIAVIGDPQKPEAWQTFVTANKQWQTWRYDLAKRQWVGTVSVSVPREQDHRFAPSDWDNADDVVGDEEDHCYINVAAGPEGFYVTVSLDCNTGSFCENLCTDAGPYATFADALAAGQDISRDWCLTNDVYADDDRLEGMTVGTPIWVKPDRRAMDDAVRATVVAWDPANHVATVRYLEPTDAETEISMDLVRGMDHTDLAE